MKILSGWGRFPKVYANEVFPNNIKELKEILSKNPRSYIARGNGRSYGDAAIFIIISLPIVKVCFVTFEIHMSSQIVNPIFLLSY